MANEMPLEVQIDERVGFREPFLHAILAKDTLAGVCRRADVLRPECFRDGDELNVGRRAGSPMRRRVDAAAHVGECLRNRRSKIGNRKFLYGIDAMALAISAFGPVGAYFTYSAISFFASGTLFCFTYSMPSS